jgi:hypothetical protein
MRGWHDRNGYASPPKAGTVTDEIRLDSATSRRIEDEIAAMAEALQAQRAGWTVGSASSWAADGRARPRSSTPPGGRSGARARTREDNLDPTDLGIDSELAQRIVAWSDEYDALFDPADFGKPLYDDPLVDDPLAESAFADRGRDLADPLAQALGDRYSVSYGWKSGDWVQLS